MYKKTTLLISLLFSFILTKATYVPVTISSGYNADVIAEGIGAPLLSTTAALDAGTSGANFAFVAQDYQYNTSCSLPAAPNYLPNGGLITNLLSTGPTNYQLAPYNANNALHLSAAVATGTLTFGSPVSAGEIYLLANSGSGTATIDVTITFTDNTTQVITGVAIADWYGGSNVVIKAARVDRAITACGVNVGSSPSGPNLYQHLITVSSLNYTKQIASLGISRATSSSGYVNVMGVVVNTPCLVPSAQATALNFSSTTSQIAGSFTASVSSPSGYLVVRYPTGASPVNPTNGTSYSVSSALGTGVVISTGATTSFTATGLFGNTTYDFYVYAYNNTSCAGGPTYNLTSPLSGTYSTAACGGPSNVTLTVGPSGTYSNLTTAVSDLSSTGISGPVVLELLSGYVSSSEPSFPITFPANACISPANNLTIRPAASASGLVITGSNAGPTFDFNGASNITLDGRPGGTSTTGLLQIINTNSGGAAMRFINDASNNTIKYCNIQGQNTSTTSTALSGVIYFATASATGAAGNDNNLIDHCDIHGTAGGTPAMAIVSTGTTTTALTYNDNCTITASNIYDYFTATGASTGIKLDAGNSAWSITDNSFYQTVARTFTSGATQRVLWVTPNTSTLAPQASGFVITGNYIGGSAPQAGGTAYTLGGTVATLLQLMDISVGFGTATSVQNNVMTNISLSSTSTGNVFIGIGQANGHVNIGNVTGNIIGSTSSNDAITINKATGASAGGTVIGIRPGGGTNAIINIAKNSVSGITTTGTTTSTYNIIGINVAGGTTVNLDNNLIGSTVLSNSISSNGSSTGTATSVTGISVSGGTTITVTNNVIANLNNTYAGTSSGQTRGIAITSGSNTVTGNSIFNLTNAAGNAGTGTSASVVGISSSVFTVSSGNSIYFLKNTHATAAVTVLGFASSSTSTSGNLITRNTIYGLNAASSNTGAILSGVEITSGPISVTNNMITLGYSETGTEITLPLIIRGIFKSTSTACNFYYNSVYIGGTNVATTGVARTFGFQRSNVSSGDNIKNNIFMNTRSNASTLAGANHYAISFGTNTSSAGNTGSVSLDNNIYYVNGTDGVMGFTTANVPSYTSGWVSGDVNSAFENPQFIDPAGSTPNLHINTTVPSFAEGSGASIGGITVDFDGQTRYGNTGYTGSGNGTDIGADELEGLSVKPNITSATKSPATTQCVATNRTINANITPAYPLTSVTLNYAFDGVAQTPIAMTGGSTTAASTWTAIIPAATPTNATVTWSVIAVGGAYSKTFNGSSYSDDPLNGAYVSFSGNNPACAGQLSLNAVFVKNGATGNVGNGTNSNATNTVIGSAYPTYYGNGRQQWLVLGSELQAAGLRAGNLSSLGFTVATSTVGSPSAVLNGYTIKLAQTSATSITSFQTPTFTTVYGPVNYTPTVSSLNTHNFTSLFNWDGTSNVIVEMCFGNPVTGSTGYQTLYTTTPFTSVVYYQVDGTPSTAACLSTTVTGTSSNRPNMVFNGKGLAAANAYSWSNGTSVNPLVATLTSQGSYTVTLSDANNCSITSSPYTAGVASDTMSLTTVTSSGMKPYFRRGKSTGTILVVGEGAPAVPENNVSYSAPDGTAVLWDNPSNPTVTNGKVIWKTTSTAGAPLKNVTIKNMRSGLKYYVRAYAYDSSANGIFYSACPTSMSDTVTLIAAPKGKPVVTVDSITANAFKVKWTNGDGAGRIVVMKKTNNVYSVEDSTVYVANAAFGTGDTTNYLAGWSYNGTQYVVARRLSYNPGGLDSVVVTNLEAGSKYNVMVFEFNGGGAVNGNGQYITNQTGGGKTSATTLNDFIAVKTSGLPNMENFDTVSTTANVLPIGWHASGTLSTDNGSSSTTGLKNYGTTSSSDRALGSLGSNKFGVKLKNTGKVAWTSLVVKYTAEQWRNGANTADNMSVQYSTDAYTFNGANKYLSSTAATWNNASANLTFTSSTSATTGLTDGNAAANRSEKVASIVTTVNPGESIWIRWNDASITTNDGMAADDVEIVPFTVTMTGGGSITSKSYADLNLVSGTFTLDTNGLATKASMNIENGAVLNATSPTMLKRAITFKSYLYGTGMMTTDAGAVITVDGDLLNQHLYFTPGSSVGSLAVKGNSNATINSLAVASYPKAGVVKVGELTANGTLTITGLLTLNSDTTGTAIIDETYGSINGAVKQQLAMASRDAIRLFSHPFSSPLLLASINNVSSAFDSAWYYGGNASPVTIAGMANSANWNWITSPTYMVGVGGVVRGSKANGGVPVKLDATGAINQGNVTVNASANATDSFITVGNPYPAGVMLGNVLLNATNMYSSAIWTWDPSKGTKGVFTAVPNAKFASAKLPSGGAFVARAVPGSTAMFSFTEADKTSSAGTKAYFREDGELDFMDVPTPSVELPEGLQLTIDQNGNNFDGLYVYFNNEATTATEKMDAPKIGNPGLNFYTKSAEGNQQSVDIRPFENGKKVVLGLNSADNGQYTVNVSDWNMQEGTELYLVDTYTGKETLLNGKSSYTFEVNGNAKSQGEGRMYLRMGRVLSTASEEAVSLELVPNPAKEMVTIRLNAPEEGKATVRVLSVTGQQMVATEMASSQHSQLTLPLNNLAAGVYMVEVTVNGEKITKQLIKQ